MTCGQIYTLVRALPKVADDPVVETVNFDGCISRDQAERSARSWRGFDPASPSGEIRCEIIGTVGEDGRLQVERVVWPDPQPIKVSVIPGGLQMTFRTD